MSYGMRTLFLKEVRRFMKVPGQTLLSPLITTTLYFVVFGVMMGDREVNGVPYASFIVAGLVMLGVVSNSFMNTSSSLFVSKSQGTIIDLLVTPLSYLEILTAMVSAAVLRGSLVGLAMWLIAGLFTNFSVAHPVWAVAYVLLVAVFFGTCGLLVAIWADKFEQINLVPTFVITPLTFLGGVFYSVDMLASPFKEIVMFNPILYMVEGLRYGLLGQSDISPWIGLMALVPLTLVALSVAFGWLRSGYNLRT